MSQITTHILDTTKGKPAVGVRIILYKPNGNNWTEIASGITNKDGRIADLLQAENVLPIGTYKLRFETGNYFSTTNTPTFYPFVEIVFNIHSSEHYHVPLLINPFGYSTYRGS